MFFFIGKSYQHTYNTNISTVEKQSDQAIHFYKILPNRAYTRNMTFGPNVAQREMADVNEKRGIVYCRIKRREGIRKNIWNLIGCQCYYRTIHVNVMIGTHARTYMHISIHLKTFSCFYFRRQETSCLCHIPK